MLLFEIFQDAKPGYEDEQDQSVPTLKDTRKTRLTLQQINSLRRMQEIRHAEEMKRLREIQIQYRGTAA